MPGLTAKPQTHSNPFSPGLTHDTCTAGLLNFATVLQFYFMMSNQDSGESFHSETNVFGPLQFIKEIYSDEISTRPLDKELCEWLMDKMHTVFVEGKLNNENT